MVVLGVEFFVLNAQLFGILPVRFKERRVGLSPILLLWSLSLFLMYVIGSLRILKITIEEKMNQEMSIVCIVLGLFFRGIVISILTILHCTSGLKYAKIINALMQFQNKDIGLSFFHTCKVFQGITYFLILTWPIPLIRNLLHYIIWIRIIKF